ncbi:MAG: sirohydrochlorin cobaltochelatase [Phascolarctobacterium sp.]|uniref:sirohydrochlorin cobaltochelatase n=1 Tax=Phascolarctobacterium sp. TaxID=2049039 RepID=UPI0026DCB9E3|nr:sirohydrochlorin cobaltochelatase [Phascolarctobacterium sp.]MDO4921043.1 sirohydrochlorin cobaltochelatase [Phascolarctobacterium sp.]
MKSLKKFAITSMACAALLGFAVTSHAAYQLSDEVKDATPALLQASQIGVKTNVNKDLANLPDKDAILVLSFGTTFKDSRAKTIEATVDAIKAAHPGVKVVTAFTSHIIIDRIKANEGLDIPTPEKALEQLKAEGYTRIAMTSLDIIPGMEYTYKDAVYNLHKNDFKKMTFGTPLMYWQGQEGQDDDITATMQALSTQFPKLGKKDAVLIMAHGTPHPANAYYAVMQDRLNELGLSNALIFSVEGWPHLDTVMPQLKAKGVKNVTLMPLMMVAGDHANNDMAGDEPDSFKSILEKEGFKVSAYIHGLGENAEVQKLFVEKANQAWDALQAE